MVIENQKQDNKQTEINYLALEGSCRVSANVVTHSVIKQLFPKGNVTVATHGYIRWKMCDSRFPIHVIAS